MPVGAGRGQFQRGSIAAPPPTFSEGTGTTSDADSIITPLRELDTGAESTSSKPGTDTGGMAGPTIGRGATRGARLETFEMRMAAARTRPTELINKRGSGGTACKLTSNYFELVRQTNWKLLQYGVDFDPPIELTKVC